MTRASAFPPGKPALFAAAVLLALVLRTPASASSFDGTWVVDEGRIAFKVVHFMHSAVGVSDRVSGTANCRDGSCTFVLKTVLSAFHSGDPDRDREMEKAARAERYPEVTASGKGVLLGGNSALVQARIRLAGREVEFSRLRFDLDKGWSSLVVKGAIPILLTSFGIEPPALIGIPVENQVLVSVRLVLSRA